MLIFWRAIPFLSCSNLPQAVLLSFILAFTSPYNWTGLLHTRVSNRPFSRWRHLTTAIRIYFVFSFLFKFVNPPGEPNLNKKTTNWRILVVVHAKTAFSKSSVFIDRFHWIRVYGSRIRKEKVAFSNGNGYVWTRPKKRGSIRKSSSSRFRSQVVEGARLREEHWKTGKLLLTPSGTLGIKTRYFASFVAHLEPRVLFLQKCFENKRSRATNSGFLYVLKIGQQIEQAELNKLSFV